MALALVAGLLASNCGGHGSDQGTVRLALAVPGGYTVNAVTYTVNQGTTVLLGPATFDVSGQGAEPSLDIALPPSSGVTITLTADATNGHHFQGTSAAFNVVSGSTTVVDVTLTDVLGPPVEGRGSLQVNGTIVPGNNPPLIASVVVAPSEIDVNQPIAVSVVATDPDGDALTYVWSATPAGSFANPTAASTTYSSPAAGTQTLQIVVTDSRGAGRLISLPVTINGTPTGAGDSGGAGGAGPSALELAELALPEDGTFTYSQLSAIDIEFGFPEDPISWGPDTLPSPQQRDAARALIRRIATLLPGSARNADNTGPYSTLSVNIPNALLTLGANPIDLFTATNLAPASGTAWDAYKAGIVADTFAPAGIVYLHGLPAGATDTQFAQYIAASSTDPHGVIGLATNIVKVALQHGLETPLRAY